MDAGIIVSTLVAGGYVVADATVKEITKDAYVAFKSTIGKVFGRRAERAIDKLAVPDTRPEGETELSQTITTVPSEDAEEVATALKAFIEAARSDAAAVQAIARSHVVLDLDAARDIAVEDIRGAQDLAVKARSGRDISVRGILMDGGREGN